MTTFAGVELLQIPPNLVSTWGSDVSRVIDLAQNANGNVITATRTDLPTKPFSLSWGCLTRAALTALTAILDARIGQLVPIWIPTYQRDVLVDGIVPFSGYAVRTDRTEFLSLIPNVSPWRFWYIQGPAPGSYRVDWFNTAADTGGGTQRWGRTPSAGPLAIGTMSDGAISSALGCIISHLRCCRMARDDYRVSYRGKAAVVEAEFIEVPSVAP
jgi:hypothetical protein